MIFYEKTSNANLPEKLIPDFNETPELSSMSWCRLNKDSSLQIDESAYSLELLLVLQGFTGQFVSMEQYQNLLFVLGLYTISSTEICQNYKEILTRFENFSTNSIKNFKEMLNFFQFPFEYNKNMSLAENRHEFKDFFSCLTNVRCAVVEGAHRCEAACRMLQGFVMAYPVPLIQQNFELSPTCTLFKPIGTQVYYCQSDNLKLNSTVLKHLRQISEKLAKQKTLIVPQTWQLFFNKVIEDMKNKTKLQQVLFDTQEEFYHEEVAYRDFNSNAMQSYKIKMYLHEVLTKAIFEYKPCKELLQLCKTQKPTAEKWITDTKKWFSLTSKPYQVVSKYKAEHKFFSFV